MSDAAAPPVGSAELSAGGAKVVIVPALGGKIASLEFGGRKWLWQNPHIPYHAPEDGASFAEAGDSGGYDECFPTIAPCTLPTGIGTYGGTPLPDHGELWSQATTFLLETRPDGMYAESAWRGERLPYRFTRAIFVSNAGHVEMRYAVTNDGDKRMPFVWSAHALLPLTKQTRIVLPTNARTRVWSQYGIELGGPGAELRWPRVASAGKLLDLSVPEHVASRFACMLFVDATTDHVTIEEADARLEVYFDPAQVPCVGLWMNKGEWSPFRYRKAYRTLGLEPCIGGAGSLSDAIGAWRSAAWLEARQTREWTLTWRGSAQSGAGEAGAQE